MKLSESGKRYEAHFLYALGVDKTHLVAFYITATSCHVIRAF